jgi:hypothetical protein
MDVFTPPGMTTRSVFTAWIADVTSNVKWYLNACNTNILCFLNNTLGLLFQITCNQSPVSSFSHPSPSLITYYWSHRQLCLKHRFLIDNQVLQSRSSFYCLMFMTINFSPHYWCNWMASQNIPCVWLKFLAPVKFNDVAWNWYSIISLNLYKWLYLHESDIISCFYCFHIWMFA